MKADVVLVATLSVGQEFSTERPMNTVEVAVPQRLRGNGTKNRRTDVVKNLPIQLIGNRHYRQ